MGDIGLPELLVLAVLFILLFGARRIPEAMRGLGEGIRNFKAGLHDDMGENRQPVRHDPVRHDETERGQTVT